MMIMINSFYKDIIYRTMYRGEPFFREFPKFGMNNQGGTVLMVKCRSPKPLLAVQTCLPLCCLFHHVTPYLFTYNLSKPTFLFTMFVAISNKLPLTHTINLKFSSVQFIPRRFFPQHPVVALLRDFYSCTKMDKQLPINVVSQC